MKTLENIWEKLQPGDSVMFQKQFFDGVFTKPRLVTIVAIDVWDMAMTVYFVDQRNFIAMGKNQPEIESFAEWTTFWNVLGHWHTKPSFKYIAKAYRKRKAYISPNRKTILVDIET